MESFSLISPNVKINLVQENELIKRAIYDFVGRIERTSPYRSVVKFFIVENENGLFSGRLEVTCTSFEILLTKQNDSINTLLEEFKDSFNDRLKPWLEGRFSA